MFFNRDKNKGLMEYFGIEHWYFLLPEDVRMKIKYYYSLSGNDPNDIDRNNVKVDISASNLLWSIGYNAISKKDFVNGKLILEKSLELSKDITSKHFSLLGLIDVFYKLRDENIEAIEYCILYCIEDIKISEEFIQEFKEQEVALQIITSDRIGKNINAWLKEKESGLNDIEILKKLGFDITKEARELKVILPSIPSFNRLAIIYEKQGRYQEAIDICRKAESLQLLDQNNKTFTSRIDKLKKKTDVS